MPAPVDPIAAILGPGVTPAGALDAGIAAASLTETAQLRGTIPPDELADVRNWTGWVEEARKFDEVARQRYALDRRLARGDSSFLVDANLVGTYIDIMESYLYARNPDFQITPGKAMRPPGVETLRDAVEQTMQADGSLATTALLAKQAAAQAGASPAQAEQAAQQAQMMLVEQQVKAEVYKLRQAYGKRNREIKAFCQTCEIIGTRMWEDAQLKRRGVKKTRSMLTVGVGIIKASWQERTEISPTTSKAINDLQENLKMLNALKEEERENPGGTTTMPAMGNQNIEQDATRPYFPGVTDREARKAEIKAQLQALQNNVERVVERGFVVDNLSPENFQIPPGYTLSDHLDAPWNADSDFPTVQQALADHGEYLKSKGHDPVALLNRAIKYAPRKPVSVMTISPSSVDINTVAAEADEFVTSGSGVGETGIANRVKRTEIWDRNANCVRTMIEGVQCWVKPIWNPPPTRRFYPYFLTGTSEVDGQRHPQSLPTRSAKLVDEYNRIGSDEAKHRRRCIPKTAFDEGNIPATEARKLEAADIQEMVGLKPTQPGSDLRMALVPIAYAPIDPALYDRQRIIGELERIWGIQEALTGSIDVEKTATEADIAQSGFQARTSGRRDAQDSTFSDLATYTIEIARQYVTEEDAIEICGPDAFWPAYGGPEDIVYSIAITVRAGSSGKPNTARERESWGALLPTLQSGIIQIGKLRGAGPEEIADALEELLKITAERSGEVIDIESLIPRGGGFQIGAPAAGPAAGQPGPGGPQPGAPEGGGAPPGSAAEMDPVVAGGEDPMAPQNQPQSFV